MNIAERKVGLEYVKADDFFRDARPTTILEDVSKELEEERAKQIIDLSALRRGEDWAYLSNKIVGAEGDYN